MRLLAISIIGAIMIVAVIIFRLLFFKNISKNVFMVLWGLIAIRLLFFVDIPIKSDFMSLTIVEEYISYQVTQPIESQDISYDDKSDDMQSHISGFTAEGVVSTAYYIVLALMLSSFALMYVSSFRRIRRGKTISCVEVHNLSKSIIPGRKVCVKMLNADISPFTYGFRNAVIVLPSSFEENISKDRENMIIHELYHIKRYDFLKKIIFAMVLCVHWFNPLVWGMYILANRDIEYCCDETVILKSRNTTPRSYAETMLKAASKNYICIKTFNAFNDTLKNRIRAVMNIKKATFPEKIISFVAIFTATMVAIVSVFSRVDDVAGEPLANVMDKLEEQSVEYDQWAAIRANDALYGSFVFSEKCVYPEDFAGTYLVKDVLHIQLTDEENLEHYRDIVSEYADNVTFDFVKYSYNKLQIKVDETVAGINPNWLSGWGVSSPENKGKIVLLDKYKDEFLKEYASRVEIDTQYILDGLIVIEFVYEKANVEAVLI